MKTLSGIWSNIVGKIRYAYEYVFELILILLSIVLIFAIIIVWICRDALRTAKRWYLLTERKVILILSCLGLLVIVAIYALVIFHAVIILALDLELSGSPSWEVNGA
jgi:hypothetical protein